MLKQVRCIDKYDTVGTIGPTNGTIGTTGSTNCTIGTNDTIGCQKGCRLLWLLLVQMVTNGTNDKFSSGTIGRKK